MDEVRHQMTICTAAARPGEPLTPPYAAPTNSTGPLNQACCNSAPWFLLIASIYFFAAYTSFYSSFFLSVQRN